MKDDPYEYEERFHDQDKKASRKERKILSNKDRSKYKKTDLDKKKITIPKGENLLEGRVLAVLADGILVDYEETFYTCSMRGALKKESQRMKNLIAIGDFVLFEPSENLTGAIVNIQPRKSILSRADQISRRKEQLIAVNIDQVLITASVVTPPLKPNLIDRYIIASLKGNMDPIIVVNKIDLLEESQNDQILFDEILKIYQTLEIPIYPVSATTGEGIEELRNAMKGKSSVFSGQSGAGKSSLINAITGSSLLTGKVVEKTRKGSHTTTSATLLPIEGKGFCIDTPGIKSFGLWDLKKEDVQQYFFEIDQIAHSCKYPDCSHMHEPDCAVEEALENNEISRLRFDSYCALIASLDERPTR